MIRLFALLFALAGPARAASPEAAGVAVARADQQTLPGLQARTQAATARKKAALLAFDGKLALPAAFPELAGAPLDDPDFLTGRLHNLSEKARLRALERVAPLDADLPPPDSARLAQARAAALDAEDAADALEQRLVVALQAALQRAPGLSRAGQWPLWAELAAAREAVGPVNEGSEGWQDRAARHAALGDEAARLTRLLDAARRAALVPQDPSLDDAIQRDLARLQDDDARFALARLRLVAPLLDEAQLDPLMQALARHAKADLDEEEAELQRRRAENEAELLSVEGAELTGSVATFEAALAEATDRRTALEAAPALAPDPLLPASLVDQQARLRVLRVDLASQDEELARRRLARARRLAELGLDQGSLTDADVSAAEARARDAQQRVAEARRGAQEADQLVADALSAVSAASVSQVQDEQGRRSRIEGQLVAFEQRLGGIQVDREAALALPPLARERASRLSETWRSADTLVIDLRKELFNRDNECARIVAFDRELSRNLPSVPSDVAAQADPELSRQVTQGVAELEDRARDRRTACRDEVAAVMAVLAKAKLLRRGIEALAPDAIQRSTDGFLVELADELRAIPVRVRGWFWDLVHTDVRSLSFEEQVRALLTLLRSSAEILVIVVLWGIIRRQVPGLAAHAAGMLSMGAGRRATQALRLPGPFQQVGVAGDWNAAVLPAVPVLLALVDALAGYLVFLMLHERASLLALPLAIWVATRVLRAVPGLVGLLLGQTTDSRPSLRRVETELRDLILSTVGALVTWWVVLRVTRFVAIGLLDADRLSDLLRDLLLVGGLGLLGLLLSRWWGPSRQALTELEENRLTRLLTGEVASPVLRAPLTAAILLVLGVRAILGLATRLVESKAGLAWLGAALARQRLKEQHTDHQHLPLSQDQRTRLLDLGSDGLSCAEELAAVRHAHGGWAREHRRGMVALVGHRGSGKSRLIALFIQGLDDSMPVVVLDPPPGAQDCDVALAWLAERLELQFTPGEDIGVAAGRMAEELSKRPPMILILEDCHRLFLRTVGGFRALRRVLGIMHGTSEEHFWLCCFHGPAWWFLEGVNQAVNLDVFRTRVSLRPLDAPQLAAWLEARAQSQGLDSSYELLVPEGAADLARALERARTSYWLLLADECEGNPQVALGWWVDSLRQGAGPETALVTLFSSPAAKQLDVASDRDLFVLTALSIHDGLDVDQLASTLNLPAGVCRATCRHLEALGVLEGDVASRRFFIRDPWLPAVDRILRQKQFLHPE